MDRVGEIFFCGKSWASIGVYCGVPTEVVLSVLCVSAAACVRERASDARATVAQLESLHAKSTPTSPNATNEVDDSDFDPDQVGINGVCACVCGCVGVWVWGCVCVCVCVCDLPSILL